MVIFFKFLKDGGALPVLYEDGFAVGHGVLGVALLLEPFGEAG